MRMGVKGDTVRLGIIGFGGRGMGQTETLLQMEDVQVAAVCDVYEDRVLKAQELVKKYRGVTPAGYSDWHDAIDDKNVDAVCVFSSWETHIPMCIYAMKAGKRVASEVGGATSLDECWELVKTSEATGVQCMLLENCCYGREELTVLNMVRKGFFGTLTHCEGGYLHDLRDEVGNGDINRHYRQRHFLHRNGELYPTHELGPIANYLDLNRGNRMTMLVSMASKAAGLHEWFKEHRPDTDLSRAQVNEGDVVTTLIRCANGETITLKHDCTLPRPYSRGGLVQGTRGLWMEDNRSIYVEGMSPGDNGHWTHRWEKDDRYMEEYKHPLWQEYEKFGLRGGHGGMDYLVLKSFIESIQDDTVPPIDVYDMAAWMSITALSEESVAMGSLPVPIPDFTSGKWLDRKNTFCL